MCPVCIQALGCGPNCERYLWMFCHAEPVKGWREWHGSMPVWTERGTSLVTQVWPHLLQESAKASRFRSKLSYKWLPLTLWDFPINNRCPVTGSHFICCYMLLNRNLFPHLALFEDFCLQTSLSMSQKVVQPIENFRRRSNPEIGLVFGSGIKMTVMP